MDLEFPPSSHGHHPDRRPRPLLFFPFFSSGAEKFTALAACLYFFPFAGGFQTVTGLFLFFFLHDVRWWCCRPAFAFPFPSFRWIDWNSTSRPTSDVSSSFFSSSFFLEDPWRVTLVFGLLLIPFPPFAVKRKVVDPAGVLLILPVFSFF